MFTRPAYLYIHVRCAAGSTTLVEKVNPACHVFGVYEFNQLSCCIRYARGDGALTFAEYPLPRLPGRVLCVALVPECVYAGVGRIFSPAMRDRILEYCVI